MSSELQPSIRFSDDFKSVVRHVPNECAVIFVKLEPIPAACQPVTFTWKRDDQPLDQHLAQRVRITEHPNAVQLAIDHVQRADAGHYTLYAHSKNAPTAPVRRDVRLVVEDRSSGDDPPTFLRRLGDQSVKVGTRTRLLVEIRSSTAVKLTWYRNERRVCESDRMRTVAEGNFHCIEIAPVTLDDGGQWMCMAENLGGRNSCLAQVNVLVPKAYKVPEFVESLRAVLTDQGTVSLECKVIGVPTPLLRWFKDSKEIKAGDVFALTANPDDPTSLGTYTCEAINCMGRAYSSSKVHVVGKGSREGSMRPADHAVAHNAPPPIFTSELKNVAVHIGQPLTLGCHVVVPPWPKSVVWYNKDGIVHDTNDRYRQIEDGLGVYMIEVKASEFCDEGDWKCVVTSNEGCVGMSTSTVTMEVPKNYRAPRFLESLKAVLTEEGLVSFECKVVGFPTPSLRWFKDGQELRPGDVYQLTGTNSLGSYCCMARNAMGETSSTALLTVEDIQNQLNEEDKLMLNEINQPPKFLLGLKSNEARINEEFRFRVQVKATPEPTLSWFRDELPVEASDRYNVYQENATTYNLDVMRVEFIDQAEWKCVAVNDFGRTVTSCFLKLLIPRHYKKPRFLENLRAVMTDEGAVNLECKVIGVPQPVLKWYKDGIELKAGDIHRIISGQDGTCSLGTYMCEARNCMGVVASSANILGYDAVGGARATLASSAGAGSAETAASAAAAAELQRNFSLSTINEERTSQMYETATAGDLSEKADLSFSFDGKDVSVSLYETPDLTEEEAMQIVEMYADQISEHITEQNIVELPPLRFVKETAQSGNLIMEAVVIDVAPDYFSHEDDLRTEAGMDDISIMEVSLHGLSSSGREEFDEGDAEGGLQRTQSSARADEFYSMSKSKHSRASSGHDDTDTDLQTFMSANSSGNKQRSLRDSQIDEALKEAQALMEADARLSLEDLAATTASPMLKREQSTATRVSPTPRATEVVLPVAATECTSAEAAAAAKRNIDALIPLAQCLNVLVAHLAVVEDEVQMQSALMMSPSSVEGSLKIIRNLCDPIRGLQQRLNVYDGTASLEVFMSTVCGHIAELQQGLSVVEKCVTMDEIGHTMIQRTSVCVIDSVGDRVLNAVSLIGVILRDVRSQRLSDEVELLLKDMDTGVRLTQDAIRSQSLMQEAAELEAAQHFTDTMGRMQEPSPQPPMAPETLDQVNQLQLPVEAEVLKQVCRPVVKIQQAIENIEQELTASENDETLFAKVHETIFQKLRAPIEELQSQIETIERGTTSLSSLEEKIGAAILDSVRPPMYELQKGFNLLASAQSATDGDRATLASVSVLESMIPPLHEIQNGLARIGEDVESGLLQQDDAVVPSVDSGRLLQTMAQSVLYFQNNIDAMHVPDSDLRTHLVALKNDLSKLIEVSMGGASGLGRYNVMVLENIKKPIDDLNYCLRQIEERSQSGWLHDLMEPLATLREKTKRSEDIMILTGHSKLDASVVILSKIRGTVESVEQILAAQEDRRADDMPQATISEEIKETEALLDELETCLKAIHEPLQPQAVSISTEEVSMLKSLAQPLASVRECLEQVQDVTIQQATFVGTKEVSTVQMLASPLQEVVATLAQLKDHEPTADDLQQLLQPLQELQHCVGIINDEIKYHADAQPSASGSHPRPAVANAVQPFLDLQNCIGNIIHQICEPHEDLSTMDDISMLKTLADPLPLDEHRPLAVTHHDHVTFEAMPSPLPSEASQPHQSQANVLMDDLNRCLVSVQPQIYETLKQLKTADASTKEAVLRPILEIEKSIAAIQHTASVFDQSVHTLKELMQPLQLLEHHINKIQELSMEQTASLPSSNVNLGCFASPLSEIKDSLHTLQEYIVEHVLDLTDFSAHQSHAQANMADDLQRCLAIVKQPSTLEALQSLSSATNLSSLMTLAQPLQELQNCLQVQQLQPLFDTPDSMSTQSNISLLKQMAKPLLELKQCLLNIEAHSNVDVVQQLSECAAGQAVQARPIVELCNYLHGFDVATLERATVMQQDDEEDVSDLQTYADQKSVSQFEAAVQQPSVDVIEPEAKTSKDDVTDGLINLNRCLDSVQNHNSFEIAVPQDNVEVLEPITQSLATVKQALMAIERDENVNLEAVLENITTPLLNLNKAIGDIRERIASEPALGNLMDPVEELQSSLVATLENIIETSPTNLIISTLERPNVDIAACLEKINEMSGPDAVRIDGLDVAVLRSPLVAIHKCVDALQRSVASKPLSELTRSAADVQQFIAAMQEVESELYFVKVALGSTADKHPLVREVAHQVDELKQAVAELQNSLQLSNEIQPLVLNQTTQMISLPVQRIEKLLTGVSEEYMYGAYLAPIAQIKTNLASLESMRAQIPELVGAMESVGGIERLVQELLVAKMIGSVDKIDVAKTTKMLQDVAEHMQSAELNAPAVSMPVKGLQKELANLQKMIASPDFNAQSVAAVVIPLEIIDMHIQTVCRKLPSVVLAKSINKLSSEVAAFDDQINPVKDDLSTLSNLNRSLTTLANLVNMSEVIRKKSREFDGVISSLKDIIHEFSSQDNLAQPIFDLQNQLYEVQMLPSTVEASELIDLFDGIASTIVTLRQRYSGVVAEETELSAPLQDLKKGLLTAQQQLISTETDVSPSYTEAIEDLQKKIESIEEQVLKKEPASEIDAMEVETIQQSIRAPLEALHSQVKQHEKAEASVGGDQYEITSESSITSSTTDMKQVQSARMREEADDSGVSVTTEVDRPALENVETVGRRALDRMTQPSDAVESAARTTKDTAPDFSDVIAPKKVAEIDDENVLKKETEKLLRKSEERELTPEEKDSLQALLAKINRLGSKIHATIVDAKIINESTADIIMELKEEVKIEDELKKNADSGNGSANIDRAPKATEPEDPAAKIAGERLIGDAEMQIEILADVCEAQSENILDRKIEETEKAAEISAGSVESVSPSKSVDPNLSHVEKSDERSTATEELVKSESEEAVQKSAPVDEQQLIQAEKPTELEEIVAPSSVDEDLLEKRPVDSSEIPVDMVNVVSVSEGADQTSDQIQNQTILKETVVEIEAHDIQTEQEPAKPSADEQDVSMEREQSPSSPEDTIHPKISSVDQTSDQIHQEITLEEMIVEIETQEIKTKQEPAKTSAEEQVVSTEGEQAIHPEISSVDQTSDQIQTEITLEEAEKTSVVDQVCSLDQESPVESKSTEETPQSLKESSVDQAPDQTETTLKEILARPPSEDQDLSPQQSKPVESKPSEQIPVSLEETLHADVSSVVLTPEQIEQKTTPQDIVAEIVSQEILTEQEPTKPSAQPQDLSTQLMKPVESKPADETPTSAIETKASLTSADEEEIISTETEPQPAKISTEGIQQSDKDESSKKIETIAENVEKIESTVVEETGPSPDQIGKSADVEPTIEAIETDSSMISIDDTTVEVLPDIIENNPADIDQNKEETTDASLVSIKQIPVEIEQVDIKATDKTPLLLKDLKNSELQEIDTVQTQPEDKPATSTEQTAVTEILPEIIDTTMATEPTDQPSESSTTDAPQKTPMDKSEISDIPTVFEEVSSDEPPATTSKTEAPIEPPSKPVKAVIKLAASLETPLFELKSCIKMIDTLPENAVITLKSKDTEALMAIVKPIKKLAVFIEDLQNYIAAVTTTPSFEENLKPLILEPLSDLMVQITKSQQDIAKDYIRQDVSFEVYEIAMPLEELKDEVEIIQKQISRNQRFDREDSSEDQVRLLTDSVQHMNVLVGVLLGMTPTVSMATDEGIETIGDESLTEESESSRKDDTAVTDKDVDDLTKDEFDNIDDILDEQLADLTRRPSAEVFGALEARSSSKEPESSVVGQFFDQTIVEEMTIQMEPQTMLSQTLDNQTLSSETSTIADDEINRTIPVPTEPIDDQITTSLSDNIISSKLASEKDASEAIQTTQITTPEVAASAAIESIRESDVLETIKDKKETESGESLKVRPVEVVSPKEESELTDIISETTPISSIDQHATMPPTENIESVSDVKKSEEKLVELKPTENSITETVEEVKPEPTTSMQLVIAKTEQTDELSISEKSKNVPENQEVNESPSLVEVSEADMKEISQILPSIDKTEELSLQKSQDTDSSLMKSETLQQTEDQPTMIPEADKDTSTSATKTSSAPVEHKEEADAETFKTTKTPKDEVLSDVSKSESKINKSIAETEEIITEESAIDVQEEPQNIQTNSEKLPIDSSVKIEKPSQIEGDVLVQTATKSLDDSDKLQSQLSEDQKHAGQEQLSDVPPQIEDLKLSDKPIIIEKDEEHPISKTTDLEPTKAQEPVLEAVQEKRVKQREASRQSSTLSISSQKSADVESDLTGKSIAKPIQKESESQPAGEKSYELLADTDVEKSVTDQTVQEIVDTPPKPARRKSSKDNSTEEIVEPAPKDAEAVKPKRKKSPKSDKKDSVEQTGEQSPIIEQDPKASKELETAHVDQKLTEAVETDTQQLTPEHIPKDVEAVKPKRKKSPKADKKESVEQSEQSPTIQEPIEKSPIFEQDQQTSKDLESAHVDPKLTEASEITTQQSTSDRAAEVVETVKPKRKTSPKSTKKDDDQKAGELSVQAPTKDENTSEPVVATSTETAEQPAIEIVKTQAATAEAAPSEKLKLVENVPVISKDLEIAPVEQKVAELAEASVDKHVSEVHIEEVEAVKPKRKKSPKGVKTALVEKLDDNSPTVEEQPLEKACVEQQSGVEPVPVISKDLEVASAEKVEPNVEKRAEDVAAAKPERKKSQKEIKLDALELQVEKPATVEDKPPETLQSKGVETPVDDDQGVKPKQTAVKIDTVDIPVDKPPTVEEQSVVEPVSEISKETEKTSAEKVFKDASQQLAEVAEAVKPERKKSPKKSKKEIVEPIAEQKRPDEEPVIEAIQKEPQTVSPETAKLEDTTKAPLPDNISTEAVAEAAALPSEPSTEKTEPISENKPKIETEKVEENLTSKPEEVIPAASVSDQPQPVAKTEDIKQPTEEVLVTAPKRKSVSKTKDKKPAEKDEAVETPVSKPKRKSSVKPKADEVTESKVEPKAEESKIASSETPPQEEKVLEKITKIEKPVSESVESVNKSEPTPVSDGVTPRDEVPRPKIRRKKSDEGRPKKSKSKSPEVIESTTTPTDPTPQRRPDEFTTIVTQSDEIIDGRRLEQRVQPPTATETIETAPLPPATKQPKRSRESRRPPTFDSRLTNRSSSVGSAVKLTCTFSGHDVHTQWFKDNEPIRSGDRYRIQQRDGIASLELVRSATDDSGLYACIVANANGEVETSATIKIFEDVCHEVVSPPVFSSGIRGEFLVKGSVCCVGFVCVCLRVMCVDFRLEQRHR